MSVVDLGSCRALLSRLAGLREKVISGEILGLAVCVKYRGGEEKVFFAGDYEDNKPEALKAAMRMSWELTKRGDEDAGRARAIRGNVWEMNDENAGRPRGSHAGRVSVGGRTSGFGPSAI